MPDTYLAFDFGMKRVGVAVGQTLTQTAHPLNYLIANEGIVKRAHIEALIKEWKPKALIVGIPLNMDGTEQTLTYHARNFAHQLQEKFALKVIEVDERLSTVEARSRMYAQGGFKALKKDLIDSMAAKLILEDWLRQQI